MALGRPSTGMAIRLWRRLRQANTFTRYSPNDLEGRRSRKFAPAGAGGHTRRRNGLLIPSTTESARSHHPRGRAQSRTELSGEVADTKAFGRRRMALTLPADTP